jgi:transposase
VAARRDAQEKLIASQQATIERLTAAIHDLSSAFDAYRTASQAREAELSAKLDALLRKSFGRSSEKMPTPTRELRKERSPEVAAALAKEKRKRNSERKAQLETDVVSHAVPDERRVCPACASTDLTETEPAERIDYGYVPGYFRRRVHRQQVLACACCAAQVVADAPPRPFEKSPYEAGLIAHVVVQKCACSVPIYRLEKQFQWLGIPLSRSTMNDRPVPCCCRKAQAALLAAPPARCTQRHRARRRDHARDAKQKARLHVDLPHGQAHHVQVLCRTQRKGAARCARWNQGHAAG